jgi:hypothetical protein
MPSFGQNGGAMNDSFAQQFAQTPSPATRLAAGHAKRRQRDVESRSRGVSPCAVTGPQHPAQVIGNGTGW